MWKITELWNSAAGGVAYLITVDRFEMEIHEKWYPDHCACKTCKSKRPVPHTTSIQPSSGEDSGGSISIVVDV